MERQRAFPCWGGPFLFFDFLFSSFPFFVLAVLGDFKTLGLHPKPRLTPIEPPAQRARLRQDLGTLSQTLLRALP